jgi:hypothetical protein
MKTHYLGSPDKALVYSILKKLLARFTYIKEQCETDYTVNKENSFTYNMGMSEATKLSPHCDMKCFTFLTPTHILYLYKEYRILN